MDFDSRENTRNDPKQGEETRKVRIHPKNAKKESTYLVLAIAAIISLMILRFALAGGEGEMLFFRPYQKLDDTLAASEKTLYQTLLASVEEIVDLRDTEGMWPEAALLEMEMIPPFANQFLPKQLRGYVWEEHDGNSWVDYIGQDPTKQQKVTFIFRLIDLHAEYHPHPHPGSDYDPNQRVAVQIWTFAETARPYPGERLPEAGWFWIVRADDPILSKPYDPQKAAAANKTKKGDQG